MDLEATLGKISHTEKDKCHLISLTGGIQETGQMNRIKKRHKLMDTESKLVVAGQGRSGAMWEWVK